MIKLGRIGEFGLDITVKGNKSHVLAPTWCIVNNYKDGRIGWDEYEKAYIKLLNLRYKTRKKEFDDLIKIAKQGELVLLCFCKNEEFCHRRLAKEYLEKLF